MYHLRTVRDIYQLFDVSSVKRIKRMSKKIIKFGAGPGQRNQRQKLELEAVRQQLSAAKGPGTGRTLEELSVRKIFGELLERESAPRFRVGGPRSRRTF